MTGITASDGVAVAIYRHTATEPQLVECSQNGTIVNVASASGADAVECHGRPQQDEGEVKAIRMGSAVVPQRRVRDRLCDASHQPVSNSVAGTPRRSVDVGFGVLRCV